jgi:PKD repeat protein
MVKTTRFSWFSLLALSAILVFSACKKEPEACFSVNRQAVIPGKLVNFINCSANSVSWNWDFGDGNTSTMAAPLHQYAAKGTYNVSLEAIGEKGDRSTYSGDMFVGDPGPLVLVIDTLRFPATQASLLELNMDGIDPYSKTVTPFDLPIILNVDQTTIWAGSSYDIQVKSTLDEMTSNVNPQTQINSQMLLRFSNPPYWSGYVGFTGR